jgi:transcriptional regulator with XRE-family HTH domain
MTPDTVGGQGIAPSNAELGRAIRRLRKARRLTIEDLAFRASMDQTYLSNIERGIRNPTWRKLSTVSKALGVSMSRIVDEAEARIGLGIQVVSDLKLQQDSSITSDALRSRSALKERS